MHMIVGFKALCFADVDLSIWWLDEGRDEKYGR